MWSRVRRPAPAHPFSYRPKGQCRSGHTAPKDNIAQVRRSARSAALVGFLGWTIHPGLAGRKRTTDESTSQLEGDDT